MKKLGVVTKEEINQLNDFINERAALCDLILSIGRAKELGIDLEENTTYKQLVHDMKMVRKNIENWWKETAERYNWEYQPNDTWNFNTDTGEIFLTKPGD
jgi:CXXX repeat modification system protein